MRLSSDAARRLALQTTRVTDRTLHATRLTGGEVIIPPGHATVITAAIGGALRAPPSQQAPLDPGSRVVRGQVLMQLVPFAPVDRDARTRAAREVAASNAQLRAADARVTRLSQMGQTRAVSQRVHEEAVAARDILRADVEAASIRARSLRNAPLLADVTMPVRAPADGVIRALSATVGQAVAAGAPLVEIVEVHALQVRVAVYAGDLTRLDPALGARVRRLSERAEDALDAAPIAGPPTASPDRATVDRYFALPAGTTLAPGERVFVELSLRSEAQARTVPRAAVFYDELGAGWIYACVGEHAFKRARIDPTRTVGEQVVFARGPAVGECVVSVGAAELYGSEFELGH